jgi:hypothetical protein
MPTVLMMLAAAIGLIGITTSQAAPASAADSQQSGVWESRKLRHITHPMTINSETMGYREVSCDQLDSRVTYLLQQFGARDVKVDQRACYSYSVERTIDVEFSVLAPAVRNETNGSQALIPAHWETLALKGDCAFLQYATKVILPSFTTRNVKLISTADCTRLGVGLYAQVLKPSQAPAVLR